MKRTEQPADLTDGSPPLRQPLLHIDAAPTPLRACLLSGGASRRMGTDKALLPHPEGGSWLERTLRLLLELESPVTLLSRHPEHLQLARTLSARPLIRAEAGPTTGSPPPAHRDDPAALPPPGLVSSLAGPLSGAAAVRLTAIAEPAPWQGPLLALHRLMELHPDERLLLCPVDMPWLTPQVLRTLLQAAEAQPQRIHLAHDGERRQPLLGLYPSLAGRRADLKAAVLRGERRLQGWLAGQDCREVPLEPAALRNVNRPEQLRTDRQSGRQPLSPSGRDH